MVRIIVGAAALGGPRAATWGRAYGDNRSVIRHGQEGRRPDAAIRLSVQRETDSHGPSGASE